MQALIAGWIEQFARSSRKRNRNAVVSWLALAVACLILLRLFSQWWSPAMLLWIDLHVPYAVNFWSEPPLFVQIHRIATGRPAYLAPYSADSWTYGPLYIYLLAAIDRLFEAKPSIVTLRLISVTIGYVTVLPLLAALVGIRLRHASGRSWSGTLVACALTLSLFGILDMRALSFTALHPDGLVYVCVAGAIAAVVWYPLARNKAAVLAILVAFCFLASLTKLNLAPLIGFLVAALAIERFIRWRLAIALCVGMVLAIAAVYAGASDALRAWTIVIPGHHWYETPRLLVYLVWRNWVGAETYQAYLVLAAIGTVGFVAWIGRKREALAWTVILGGVFGAAYMGLAKQGGGPFDLWFFYVACLIPTGAAVDALFRVSGGRFKMVVVSRLVALAYLGVITMTVPSGPHQHALLPPEGRRALQRADLRLARLCRPGHTVIVTWFVDPFLDCQNAQFSTWDAIGEILTARSHGYGSRIFLDDPIGAATLIEYGAYPLQVRFSEPHVETTIEIWDGYSFGYSPKKLYVWTPRGVRPP